MQNLADFLRRYRDEIVARWCDDVESLPSATTQTRRRIRDHVPQVLDELAHSLDERAAADALDNAAGEHAKGRFADGYDVREVVTEYELLRRRILEAYVRHAENLTDESRERVAALAALDRRIDAAICDAVDRFVEERDRARDVLVGILGHDLRSPLHAILMGADLLTRQGDLGAANVPKVAARIDASARRMERMISDLLDFTRAHLGGGIPITPAPVDLVAVARDVVEEVTHAHPDRRLDFHPPTHRAGREGSWDAARIAQALSNLINNAIQHGKDPIEVRVFEDADAAGVEIRNGGSIPPDVLGRVFQPFAHAAARTSGSSRHGGLGLGLYIVSEIARAHGGTVEVGSADELTRFRLVLPWPVVP